VTKIEFFQLTGTIFGAHALKAKLEKRNSTSAWETAARYQMVHFWRIMLVGLYAESGIVNNANIALLCLSVGIVLFSGSL